MKFPVKRSNPDMIRSKEAWKQLLEEKLPARERIVDRNRAITAHYAQLYLQCPELFKWSGMAAFASSQVGVALAFVELLETPSAMMKIRREDVPRQDMISLLGGMAGFIFRSVFSLPVSVFDSALRTLLLDDLNEIRIGNNNIYQDIAWAHAAYMEGGLSEIAANADEQEKELMLQGFSLIDRGAALLKAGDDAVLARSMIRDGNICLLRHEQLKTLYPVFNAISIPGRVVVSFGSELDFQGAAPPGVAERASFAEYSGYLETLTGARRVTDQDDRWNWIENNVLPVWNAIDSTYATSPHLERKLREMACGNPSMLQQIARFASTMSFLPGLE
ncbi:MAG: hypothetical protein C1942_03910 [Prosthecochloris sp.]|nr:hypothetical protein [Prosthecochloris sp.]